MRAFDAKVVLLATSALALVGSGFDARAQGAPVENGPSLQEIVVTAQRRQENLQSTPLAITALSPHDLETRNVQSTQDLMQVTPSLQVSTQTAGNGSGSATFFLRGMGQQRSGNGTSPAVGIYVDDFYYPSLQGSIFSLLDIQQIEVLRGPQGTLFGRNTIGGAIRYTTQAPDFDKLKGYVQGTFGSFDRADVSGSINVPVSDDAAFRLTAGRLRTDGYVHQQNGGKDAGATQTDLVRGQFRYAPTDALDVRLVGQYNHNKINGFTYWVPAPISPIPGTLPFAYNNTPAGRVNPYDSRYASQCDYCQAGTDKREFSDTTYKSANATVTWHINDALKLKSLTGWQRVQSDYLKDLDASPLPINNTVASGVDRAFSQELQLSGDMLDQRLNWVVGAYYYDEKHNDLFPKAGEQINLGRVVPTAYLTAMTTTKAAFVDATYKVTDQLTVLGGFRYSEDAKKGDIQTAAAGLLAKVDTTFGSETWRLGAQMQFTPEIMSYATISRGFRAGGFGKISNSARALDTFDPETATNYEVGARMDLFDRRLRINPTLFYTQWDNIQVQRIVPGATGVQIFVDNAAKAHSQGFELEAEAVVTENLHITANMALLDIKYDEVGATNTITLNSHFQRAPALTYSIGAEYGRNLTDALRLTAAVNYSFEAHQYAVPSDLDQLLLPSYALLNARLQLLNSNAGWSVAVFGTNLTDEVYYVGGDNFATSTGAAQYDLGRPREFGVNLRYTF